MHLREKKTASALKLRYTIRLNLRGHAQPRPVFCRLVRTDGVRQKVDLSES